ncbi:MAG: hypothetical protein AB1505_17960 [Candidatus Latescibacterota bacterium]
MTLLLLLLLSCTAALAHAPDTPVYCIWELTDAQLPDLHDGTLADWQAVLPGPTFTEADFGSLPVGDGAAIGPPDLAVSVWVAWSRSRNRIWAAIERADNVYVNSYEGGDTQNLWMGDGAELLVDGDHGGGTYDGWAECSMYKPTTAGPVVPVGSCDPYRSGYFAQVWMALPQSPDQDVIGLRAFRVEGTQGPHWASRIPWADGGGYVQPGPPQHAAMEIMVTPFDELRPYGELYSVATPLVPGRVIGLQVSVPDWDVPGRYHGFHTLRGRANTWRDADQFVDVLLLGADRSLAQALQDPDLVDVRDFRLSDHDGDGVAEANETVHLLFAPQPGTTLPAGGISVRLRCDDPDVRLARQASTVTTDPRGPDGIRYEPLALVPEARGVGLRYVELALEVEQAGQVRRWPLALGTRFPRLPVDSLVVVDHGAGCWGNGDRRLQAGETVRLELVLGTRSTAATAGTSAWLRAADDRVRELDAGPLSIAWGPGAMVATAPTRFVADGRLVEGAPLGFALATELPFATWVDNLVLRVAAGRDATPPVFEAPVQVWQGEAGLSALFPAAGFLEGSMGGDVWFELSRPGGSQVRREPMERRAEYWLATGLDVPPGEYHYRLQATDVAGNLGGTEPVATTVRPDARQGEVLLVAGGGDALGAALGPYVHLANPRGLALGPAGRLWIADSGRNVLLRWEPSGLVERVAGSPDGVTGPPRDGRAASAWLNRPAGVAADAQGRVFVADAHNRCVRRIDPDGSIATVAGGGTQTDFAAAPVRALDWHFERPVGLALDAADALYVADEASHRVLRVDRDGGLALVAGGGEEPVTPEGVPGTAADVGRVCGMAVDGAGNLVLATTEEERVLALGTDGRLRVLLDDPDLGVPRGLAANAHGDLFVAGQGDLYVSGAGTGRIFLASRVVAPRGQDPVSAVADGGDGRPPSFRLDPAFPNPFNQRTVLSFAVAQAGPVHLAVHNAAGQRARLLVDGVLGGGAHQASWDGRDQAGYPAGSGVYFCRLAAAGGIQVRKVALAR